MPFPKKKIVCVEWEDAANNNGYYNKDHPEYTSTAQAKTVGYLIENKKKVLKLAVETFSDGDMRHIHSIPKGMVRKITYLEEAK